MEYNVYDFDKTLYEKDSTIEFYLYCLKNEKSIIRYLPVQVFYLILFKFCRKDKYKEKFFIFLRSVDEVEKKVKKFWGENKHNIRYNLLDSESKKIVISASPEFLLKDICMEIGIDKLIATKVNPTTGLFESKNCHDYEKLQRLKEEIPQCRINNFYSDSYSDEFLAHEANEAFLIDGNGKKKKWSFKR